MMIKPVRGTHDIYGENLVSYRNIEKTIKEIAEIYDFNEIITPIFEDTELFKKPLGEQTDVVLKEMYSFKDLNTSSLTLRPEYTTPIIRAAISNKLFDKLPVKLFGLGPMFRRERPQKGRFRQFNQINFEIFGTDDSFADSEIILLASDFLEKIISKKSYKLFINSLGDRKTILDYKKVLSDFFEKNKKLLSENSVNKISTNPLRILDSKNKNDKIISLKAPKISDFYSKSAKLKFDQVQSYLSKSNIDFEIDINLVRGLDYYCHTVFEFKSHLLGSQDTIIGGGRYDGLIKMLGGPDLPGVGWASGVERLMMLSEKKIGKKPKVHVITLEEKYKEYSFNLINNLRKNSIRTTCDYKNNLKKSLRSANTKKIEFAIIIGEEEFKKNNYTLKDLINGKQRTLNLNDIIKTLSL